MQGTILEKTNFVSGFVPVDMSAGANTGDYVNVKNYERFGVLLFKAAGTAGDDPTLTITQATDNTGAGAKALTFTTVHTKQGTLTSVGTWTEVTQSAANTYTDATSAEVQAVWFVEFQAEDLDVNNDFDHIRASVGDIGTNAQVGAMLYVLSEPRYVGPADEAASPL